MATLEWTPKARDYIKAKEYKYLSCVFIFNNMDPKTGAHRGIKLQSVALTNTPFLDELGEVRATKAEDASLSPNAKKPIPNKGISMPEEEIKALKQANATLKQELEDIKTNNEKLLKDYKALQQQAACKSQTNR